MLARAKKPKVQEEMDEKHYRTDRQTSIFT
jgi:hypothetical protein